MTPLALLVTGTVGAGQTTIVELGNLDAMAATFRRRGAQRLVLAGVLETRADRKRVETAVGMPLTVCRLRRPLDVVSSPAR